MDRSKKVVKMIENPEERQRVFERLSKELLEEAAAISSETGAKIKFVGFTPDGKTFSFGSSSDGAIFNQPISEEKVNRMIEANQQVVPVEESETESEDEEEEEQTDVFGRDNIDVDKIDTPEKAHALKKALLEAKKKVATIASEKRQKLASASSTGQQQ